MRVFDAHAWAAVNEGFDFKPFSECIGSIRRLLIDKHSGRVTAAQLVIAFGAKVMPVRVLGACGGTVADISDAITWSSGGAVAGVTSLSPAAAAKVINMSLSGAASTCSTTYQTAINGAVSRGTTRTVPRSPFFDSWSASTIDSE